MTTTTATTTDGLALERLPYYSALKDYGDGRWICFATLTHAHDKPLALQEERARELLHMLGRENNCYGTRLHWIIRAEGGHKGERGATPKDEARPHLHLLLSEHKIIGGHIRSFTREEACSFLERNWTYGRAHVRPFDAGRGDLEYVLKAEAGPAGPSWDDRVTLSPSLLAHLKEKKSFTMPLGLSRFASKRLAEMKIKKPKWRGHATLGGRVA